MLFSLATAARFMRHATTIRAAFSVPMPRSVATLADRYEGAAAYLHLRFKRSNHEWR